MFSMSCSSTVWLREGLLGCPFSNLKVCLVFKDHSRQFSANEYPIPRFGDGLLLKYNINSCVYSTISMTISLERRGTVQLCANGTILVKCVSAKMTNFFEISKKNVSDVWAFYRP